MSVLWTAGLETSKGIYKATNSHFGQSQTTFTLQYTSYLTGESENKWLDEEYEQYYRVIIYEQRRIVGVNYYYYSQTPARNVGVTRGENPGEYIANYSALTSTSYTQFKIFTNNFPPLSQ